MGKDKDPFLDIGLSQAINQIGELGKVSLEEIR